MCGRYALTSPPAVIAERFGLAWPQDVEPHYNIAPSQMIPVVRETEAGRALAMLQWGLIPWWAKDATIGAKIVNARAETLADKPAFRDAYRSRHCLIPADAFYEWKAGRAAFKNEGDVALSTGPARRCKHQGGVTPGGGGGGIPGGGGGIPGGRGE